MITQLSPSIPMRVVENTLGFPEGSGEALMVLDYGKEDDLLFVMAMDNGGEIWIVPNKYLRLIRNISIGRL